MTMLLPFGAMPRLLPAFGSPWMYERSMVMSWGNCFERGFRTSAEAHNPAAVHSGRRALRCRLCANDANRGRW